MSVSVFLRVCLFVCLCIGRCVCGHLCLRRASTFHLRLRSRWLVLVGLGLSLLQRLEDFHQKTGYDQTLAFQTIQTTTPPARESIIASRKATRLQLLGVIDCPLGAKLSLSGLGLGPPSITTPRLLAKHQIPTAGLRGWMAASSPGLKLNVRS